MALREAWLQRVRTLTAVQPGVRPDLQLALLRLDDDDRRELRRQCRGNWSRVTVSQEGAFVIHPHPQPHPQLSVPRPRVAGASRPVTRTAVEPQAALPGSPLQGLLDACDLRASTRRVARQIAAQSSGGHDPDGGPLAWRPWLFEPAVGRLQAHWQKHVLDSRVVHYPPGVRARSGVPSGAVAAVLDAPQRVEAHPASFVRYELEPVVSLERDRLAVMVAVRRSPLVLAVLVTDPPERRRLVVPPHGEGVTTPARYEELFQGLRALGATLRPHGEFGLCAKLDYRGEEVWWVNAGDQVPEAIVGRDWWWSLWAMHMYDQRRAPAGGTASCSGKAVGARTT